MQSLKSLGTGRYESHMYRGPLWLSIDHITLNSIVSAIVQKYGFPHSHETDITINTNNFSINAAYNLVAINSNNFTIQSRYGDAALFLHYSKCQQFWDSKKDHALSFWS